MNLVLGIMLFSHKYVLDIYCGKSRDKDTKKKKIQPSPLGVASWMRWIRKGTDYNNSIR
jgi:hypothetical protein